MLINCPTYVWDLIVTIVLAAVLAAVVEAHVVGKATLGRYLGGVGAAGAPSLDGSIVAALVVGLGHGTGLGSVGNGAVLLGLGGEQLEFTLLGYKASGAQALDSVLASSVCLLGNNASSLILHKVGLYKSTSSALGCAVKYLCLRANSYFEFGVGHVFF